MVRGGGGAAAAAAAALNHQCDNYLPAHAHLYLKIKRHVEQWVNKVQTDTGLDTFNIQDQRLPKVWEQLGLQVTPR